jgi:hypothetical protein
MSNYLLAVPSFVIIACARAVSSVLAFVALDSEKEKELTIVCNVFAIC